MVNAAGFVRMSEEPRSTITYDDGNGDGALCAVHTLLLKTRCLLILLGGAVRTCAVV